MGPTSTPVRRLQRALVAGIAAASVLVPGAAASATPVRPSDTPPPAEAEAEPSPKDRAVACLEAMRNGADEDDADPGMMPYCHHPGDFRNWQPGGTGPK